MADQNQNPLLPTLDEDEQFVSSESFMNADTALDWDALVTRGNNSNHSQQAMSKWERDSLYVKFDPLVASRKDPAERASFMFKAPKPPGLPPIFPSSPPREVVTPSPPPPLETVIPSPPPPRETITPSPPPQSNGTEALSESKSVENSPLSAIMNQFSNLKIHSTSPKNVEPPPSPLSLVQITTESLSSLKIEEDLPSLAQNIENAVPKRLSQNTIDVEHSLPKSPSQNVVDQKTSPQSSSKNIIEHPSSKSPSQNIGDQPTKSPNSSTQDIADCHLPKSPLQNIVDQHTSSESIQQSVERHTSPEPSLPVIVEQQTSPKSLPQTIVEQHVSPKSPPQIIVEQHVSPKSPPQIIVEQHASPKSPPQIIVEQHASPKSPPPIIVQQTSPQASTQIIMKQHKSPKSPFQNIVDHSSPKPPPQNIVEHSSPKSLPQNIMEPKPSRKSNSKNIVEHSSPQLENVNRNATKEPSESAKSYLSMEMRLKANVDDYVKQKERHDKAIEERDTAIEERAEAQQELKKAEARFTEMLMLYEKVKDITSKVEQNCVILQKREEILSQILQKRELRDEAHKKMCAEVFERMQREFEARIKEKESENMKLKAKIRMCEMKTTKLEGEVSQVDRESESLRKLCEDLMKN